MARTFEARVIDGSICNGRGCDGSTCYAEARIDAKGWQGAGGPIIYSHGEAGNDIVAWTTRIWPEGDSMMIEARFKEGDPVSDFLWGKVLDGTLPDVSISAENLEKSPPTAEELAARPELAGCTMIRRCRVIEVSIVIKGGCPGAKILSINGVPTNQAA